MQLSEIPRKKEYRVGEVCELADTQPYVLQFWESEFPQLSPKVRGSGARLYSRRDLETVLEIKRLLQDESLSIAQARDQIKSGKKATSVKPAAASKVLPRQESQSSVATVERDRYDAALREIQRLKAEVIAKDTVEMDQAAYDETRRKLTEFEAALVEANHEIKTLRSESEDRSTRAIKLADRLDALADRLNAARQTEPT